MGHLPVALAALAGGIRARSSRRALLGTPPLDSLALSRDPTGGATQGDMRQTPSIRRFLEGTVALRALTAPWQ
jgi:hypothetical protein